MRKDDWSLDPTAQHVIWGVLAILLLLVEELRGGSVSNERKSGGRPEKEKSDSTRNESSIQPWNLYRFLTFMRNRRRAMY